MERLLTSVRLSTLLKIAMLVPILYAAWLSSTLIEQHLQHNRQQQQSREVVQISRVLADLAHQFAAERGRSAGFLGSAGQGAEALTRQRQQADLAAKALIRLTLKITPTLTLVAWSAR